MLFLGAACSSSGPRHPVMHVDAPYEATFRAAERALRPARISSASLETGLIETGPSESLAGGPRVVLGEAMARARYRLQLWPAGDRTAIDVDIRVQRRVRIGPRSVIWRAEPTPPTLVEALLTRIRRDLSASARPSPPP